MKVSYPFLSSCRTFEWQRSRQANASPILLDGTLVKRLPAKTSWDGLSLSSSNLSTTVTSRGTRYWADFTNGRRTVDPAFDEVQYYHSRSLSATKHPSDLGFRTKSVTRDGKAVRPNTSSTDNMLRADRQDLFKGMELYQQQTAPQRKGRGKSEYYLRLSVSQIVTLPGASRALPEPPTAALRQSKKNVSQITTLPGGCVPPQPDLTPTNSQRYFKRNLATTAEAEETFGATETRRSPVKTATPNRTDLPSYREVGSELGRRGKGGQQLHRTNRETTRETAGRRGGRKRPESMVDLFAPTFRMF